jgi:hypothetical protein
MPKLFKPQPTVLRQYDYKEIGLNITTYKVANKDWGYETVLIKPDFNGGLPFRMGCYNNPDSALDGHYGAIEMYTQLKAQVVRAHVSPQKSITHTDALNAFRS